MKFQTDSATGSVSKELRNTLFSGLLAEAHIPTLLEKDLYNNIFKIMDR
jgi:hypothetical protein